MVLKKHVITVSLLLGDEILVTEEWVLQSKEETLASNAKGMRGLEACAWSQTHSGDACLHT
jgi:hypothetical protein